MKRMLLLAILCWSHTTQAQDITGVEYYINNDPGFGNGTPIDISAGPDIPVNFTADLTGIEDGIHVLYVRAHDANGVWSLPSPYPFLRTAIGSDPSRNITQAEYFIDHDPGFGSATQITLSTGPDATVGFAANLNGLEAGLHILYVRAQDINGVWSLLHSQPFLKTPAATDPAPDITRIEYFIDIDPGFGNGTTVSPSTGSDQSLSFLADLNSLGYGFHTLYVRSQDAGGHWSLPLAHTFLKEMVEADGLASVVQAEYFIDVDPGYGQATTVSLTPGTDIGLSFTADLNGVPNGIHVLYVRTQDATGTWCLTQARPFLMENGVADDPLPPVTRITYSFKKDGLTSTPRSFTNFNPSPDTDLNFTANLSGLSAGDWVMQAAAVDAVGRSSLLFTQSVEVFAAAVGDLTLDGVLNIADVVALVQIILGQNPTPDTGSAAFTLADFNGDGLLNILDLIGQINTIIGVQVKVTAGADQPVKIEFGEVDMIEVNEGLLPIALSSTNRVAGIQADLTFNPALIQLGTPYLTEDYTSVQIEHYITDGTMRLLLYNADGGTMSLAADTKLLVPVTLLNESVEEATIALNGITLANPQAQMLPTAPGITTMTIRALPKEFSLSLNRPNPFNPSTQIAYDVPEPAHMTLVIYNVLGQEIIRLVDEQKQAGRYVATWNGQNRTGHSAASGVYLYRMVTSTGYTAQRRMTLLK